MKRTLSTKSSDENSSKPRKTYNITPLHHFIEAIIVHDRIYEACKIIKKNEDDVINAEFYFITLFHSQWTPLILALFYRNIMVSKKLIEHPRILVNQLFRGAFFDKISKTSELAECYIINSHNMDS